MKKSIVLYDSECQFCNKWICFIKSKSPKNEISFFSFNSNKAINILEDYRVINQNSVSYIKDNVVYLKSRAVLKICRQLKFPYNLLHFLTILPTFFLDFCYGFIAKRRFLFNQKTQCCNG